MTEPHAARDDELERLRAALARIRALHVPVLVHERCGHPDHDAWETTEDGPEPVELDDGTWTCSTRTWQVCQHCCCEGDELSEACEPGRCWPCPTVHAMGEGRDG